jgi:phage-related protein
MAVLPNIKPVFWIGRTKEDLSDFHDDVRNTVGQALFEAQSGGKHSNAKPLRGFGDASVMEIVGDHAGDTFRAVYTVRWPERVYVLHVFQKKSKSGIRTAKADIELIGRRLRRLRELHTATTKR